MLRSSAIVGALASVAAAGVVNVCLQQPYSSMLDFKDFSPATSYCAPHFPAQTVISTALPTCLVTTSTVVLGTSTVTATSTDLCPTPHLQARQFGGWGGPPEGGFGGRPPWAEGGWGEGPPPWLNEEHAPAASPVVTASPEHTHKHHKKHHHRAKKCSSSGECSNGDQCYHDNKKWYHDNDNHYWCSEESSKKQSHGHCVPPQQHANPSPNPNEPQQGQSPQGGQPSQGGGEPGQGGESPSGGQPGQGGPPSYGGGPPSYGGGSPGGGQGPEPHPEPQPYPHPQPQPYPNPQPHPEPTHDPWPQPWPTNGWGPPPPYHTTTTHHSKSLPESTYPVPTYYKRDEAAQGSPVKREIIPTKSAEWVDYQLRLVQCGYDCIQTACSCIAATTVEYHTPAPTCTETKTKSTMIHTTTTIVVAAKDCDHADLRKA